MNSPINLRAFAIALAGVLLLLSGCGQQSVGTPIFHAEGKPKQLSDWNLLSVASGDLQLADGVVAYDLNTALFSDYAHKLRTVWLPDGTQASYNETDTFDFPVGTIISKTFYYPTNASSGPAQVIKAVDTTAERLIGGFNLDEVKLIETRLLVHREEGWVALPYVWNEDETEAVLKRVGDIKQLELVSGDDKTSFAYVVPNQNQCAGCHATNATTRKVVPIGPKSRHLNKDYTYAHGNQNQLAAWQELGILGELPSPLLTKANASWGDGNASLNDRARSYLDINCSHCHNKVGPADTSGLLLEPADEVGPSLGVCKLPIAAGTGTGDRKFGIVPGKPGESIFTYRMESVLPSEMMPELGRSLSHDEGVSLIAEWIAKMEGRDCS
ncbi:MAG: SO2930 family diheme c-type cytochrome [Pseudomonadota bacterium]